MVSFKGWISKDSLKGPSLNSNLLIIKVNITCQIDVTFQRDWRENFFLKKKKLNNINKSTIQVTIWRSNVDLQTVQMQEAPENYSICR